MPQATPFQMPAAVELPSAEPASASAALSTVTLDASGAANLPVPVLELKVVQSEGSLVAMNGLTAQDHAEIAKFRASVDFDKAQTVYTYANSVLEQNSQTIDRLLAGVGTAEAGLGGDLVIALKQGKSEFQGFNFAKIKEELAIDPRTQEGSISAFLRTAPFVGKFFSQLEYLRDRHTEILAHFDAIAAKAKARRRVVVGDEVKVELERKSSRSYLRNLGLAIIGGEQALLAGKAAYDLKAQELAASPDLTEIGVLRSRHANLIQFEDRLVNLQLALVRGVTVNETEMQMALEAGRIAIGKIENMLTIDLPQFKRAIFAVLVASNIKRAQADGEDFSNAAAQAEEVAAEIMGDAFKTAKASQGDVLEKVKQLAALGDKVLSALDEGLTLEEQSTEKRAEAKRLLIEVKNNYSERMLGIADKHAVR